MKKEMKTQAIARTRNYKKFYALLGMMPGGIPAEELKETWVSEFTERRTVSVQEMTDLGFALMLGAMEQHVATHDPQTVKMDKARKRVIAVIGAWLRARHMAENIAFIKAIACRAAKAEDFNAIPLSKLRALYEEWRGKNRVSVETDVVAYGIENSLAMMN